MDVFIDNLHIIQHELDWQLSLNLNLFSVGLYIAILKVMMTMS